MDIGDVFSYDEENGVWIDNFLGTQTIFFNEILWNAMVENMYKVFGSAGAVFLYQSGMGAGEEISKVTIQRTGANDIAPLFRLAAHAGWGRFWKETDPEDPDNIIIKSKRNFFCDTCHKSDTDHVCPFVRGFLTGVFSELAGVPHVLEITCCYVHGGAEDSTFSLKPVN